MARGRSGGAGAWVALVVVSGGFVIALILAILLNSRNEQYKTQAETAQKEKAQFVNRSLEADERVIALKGSGLVVQQLLDQLEAAKNLQILGGESASLEELQAKFESQANRLGLSAENWLAALLELEARLNKANSEIEGKEGQLASAARQVKSAEAALSQRTKQVKRAIEQAKADTDAAVARLGEGGAFIERQINQLKDSYDAQAEELNQQLALSQEQIETLQANLAEYRDVLGRVTGSPDDLIAAMEARTRPDSTVTDVYNDNAITIGIGQNDRVMPGMTFEVFAPGEAIRVTGSDDDFEGKASLEVVSVNDSTAVCRLVAEKGDASVNVGDSVVNLVYDPNYSFNFLVFGEFDIDGRGRTSMRDRARVEGLIKRWGGSLFADKLPEGEPIALNSPAGRLTYTPPVIPAGLDFLVLGQEPELPASAPDASSGPDEIRAYNESFAKLQTYQDIVAQAREMGVPVLNQNRFLALVGYYRR